MAGMDRAPPSRTPRHRWIPSRRAGIWLGVLLLAMAVLVVLFDWNWFKRPLERLVEARTGRALHIEGDLDVDLARVTTLTAHRIRFANAAWSKAPVMARADRVEVDIAVWPLLFARRVRVPGIRLAKPDVLLETGPRGVGNWVFGEDDGGEPLRFERIRIEDGRLRYIDAPRRTDIDLRVNSAKPRDGAASPPVDVDGKGHWAGNAFRLSGRSDSPLELADTARPYRIDLRASAGRTRAQARGTLTDPFRLRGIDLRFALSGENLDDLYPLIGVALPPTPPYRFDGRLGRDGDTWHYESFTGRVGDSDLGGSAAVTVGRTRPRLVANLVSKRLDFDDLAGFVGAPPDTGGKEASNAELRAQSARLAASPTLLPDTPYNLDKLRAMDADVRLKAQRIDAPSLPIDDMDAHLKLEAGLLRLEPLNFGVAGGDIRADIRMDAREPTIRTTARIAARRLNLARLFPDAKLTQDAVGRIGGDIAVTGRGNSVAAMLGSADGDIALGMGKGRISNLLMELAGIDIAEALKFLITKDRKVPIRCAFGDFAVRDGLMRTRALAFDTEDTIIIGKGEISLKHETLDLELRPRPKDRSILALRSPLVVGGTFKDPSFRPDYKRLGLRGVFALALGSIAPPAALLATLELGPGEDSRCGGEYAR
jgi:uncharacterized protein involved in outer membrane biogenesis